MASSRARNTCSRASSRWRRRSSTCRCMSDASCICFSTKPCKPKPAPPKPAAAPLKAPPAPPSTGLALRHQVLAAVLKAGDACCTKGGGECAAAGRALPGEGTPPLGSTVRGRRRPARDSRCRVFRISPPDSWSLSRVFLMLAGESRSLSAVLPNSALVSRMRSRVCRISLRRSARDGSSGSAFGACDALACSARWSSCRASRRNRSSSRASSSWASRSWFRFRCFCSSTCAAKAL
mmetsp:Transcript_114286/g.354893  ORF Transcript_114286/g.354893 Transcript_114286/m.354893 type:complete len:236 (+) Transcript_114286:796-1503(+)